MAEDRAFHAEADPVKAATRGRCPRCGGVERALRLRRLQPDTVHVALQEGLDPSDEVGRGDTDYTRKEASVTLTQLIWATMTKYLYNYIPKSNK